MTVKEHAELVREISEVGYVKCVNQRLIDKGIFRKNKIYEVMAIRKKCVSDNPTIDLRGGMAGGWYVKTPTLDKPNFEPASEKEILMHSLK